MFNAFGKGEWLGYPWITLVGFSIFAITSIWIILDLRKRVNTLEDNRPSIEVTPENGIRQYRLKVTNNGAPGKFETQIKIISGQEFLYSRFEDYLACWEYSDGKRAEIFSGQFDKLMIADYVIGEPPHLIQRLSLYTLVSEAGYVRKGLVSSSSWEAGSIITSEDGVSRPAMKPEFVLQVTINSELSLREGVFRRCYKLGLSGLEELPDTEC